MDKNQTHPELGVTFKELHDSHKRKKELQRIDEEWGEKVSLPIPWFELNKLEFPKDQWRIEGLLPKEGFVIVSSIAGERKTWFCLDMARCLSLGENFLGDPRFETRGCNVLYIDCENSRSELQRRGRQLGFVDGSVFNLQLYNDKEINLNSDEGEAWLHAAIEYFDFKVVFIDTLRAVAGGLKEEKAEEVRAFYGRYRSLKDKGVTVVWLDHFRKPNNFEKRIPQKEMLLGSTDKTAGVEVLLMLKSEPGSEEIQVYQRKNRLAKELEPFRVSMRDELVDGETRTTLLYEGIIEEKETQKAEAKKYALELLADGGRTSNEILDAIGTQQKIGHKNIRAALSELVAEGRLDVGRKGRQNYYFIIEESPLEESLVSDEIL